MGHVKGIGGLFFRARDPDTLTAWYRERLGVGAGCSADDSIAPDEYVWNVTAGPLVFSPFKADSDYFPAEKQYMLNLRVDDLDAVLAPFHEAGDEVITKDEWNDPTVGRFARVMTRTAIRSNCGSRRRNKRLPGTRSLRAPAWLGQASAGTRRVRSAFGAG